MYKIIEFFNKIYQNYCQNYLRTVKKLPKNCQKQFQKFRKIFQNCKKYEKMPELLKLSKLLKKYLLASLALEKNITSDEFPNTMLAAIAMPIYFALLSYVPQ